MTRFFIVPLALLAFATSARGDDAKAAPKSDTPMMTRSGPGQATQRRTITVKAKVTAVDPEKRTITLEGKEGKPETFVVSERVKRLNEIAPGDMIVLKYEQAVVLQFEKEGEKSAEPSGVVVAKKGDENKPPSAVVGGQVRGTVTVSAVDPKTRTVVMETPKGELVKVKADKSINLSKVKAGQKYYGVYTEAVAVSVEKAKAPAAKTEMK